MKRILSGLATAAVLLIGAGAALADGLPYSGGSIKDSPMPQAGCAQFGGFYLGANLGSTMYHAERTDQDGYFNSAANKGNPGFSSSYSTSDDAFSGGLQGGYNFQKGCTVFGIEGDWTWTDAKADISINPNYVNNGTSPASVNSHLKNFGTLRTRDGIVVDNVFLYVTGGLAWANIDTKYSGYCVSGPCGLAPTAESFSFSDTRFGWTAGFGSDWAINKNLSLTSQVLYVGLESADHSFSSACGCNYTMNHDDSFWVTRIGLNYRFGDRREEMGPLK